MSLDFIFSFRYVGFHIGRFLVLHQNLYYFFLRSCGWQTANPSDYCFGFRLPPCYFHRSRKSWASAVAAAESFIFFGRLVVLNPDVAEGHALYNSAVAVTESINLADPLVVSLPIQTLYVRA